MALVLSQHILHFIHPIASNSNCQNILPNACQTSEPQEVLNGPFAAFEELSENSDNKSGFRSDYFGGTRASREILGTWPIPLLRERS